MYYDIFSINPVVLWMIAIVVAGVTQTVDSLRCYQCMDGYPYSCDESQMYPVTCSSTQTKCGMAKILHETHFEQWRGCIDPDVDTDIVNNPRRFGSLVMSSSGMNITATEYSSCFTDLCNQPLQCYTCTSGQNTSCSSDDVGLRNCLLNERYCIKMTLDSYQVWKGCISLTQLNYLQHYSAGRSLALALGVLNGVSANLAYTLDVCTDSMCNHGGSTSSSSSLILAYLLSTYISISFYFLHSSS